MKRIVAKYIEKNKLLNKTGNYIVALSGGADSVALLMLLYDLGYNIEAAHCNFHLRGKESDRDEGFCQELCTRFAIPFHKIDFNTLEYAKKNKVSIEMAARELRYNWFSRLCNEKNANGVCVAHHKDDSAETILINLIRGTGINGLTGIKPCSKIDDKNEVRILRPLLCVGKQEIIDYLSDIGENYITDSSNLKDDVVRNKMRLNIIPQLKAINPKAVENILRTAENLMEIANRTDESKLYEQLKGFGFNGKQVRQIAENTNTGKEFFSKDYGLLVDRGRIFLHKTDETANSCHTLIVERKEIAKDFTIPKSKNVACLDAAKVKMPLTLRMVQSGDKFIPYGMTGKKLVSEYLTDIKMPLTEKRRQLVVCDATGKIVWLVNQRPDNRCCVTAETMTVLLLNVQD